MESRGSFESKHAAIRAMYTETVKNGGPKTGMAVPDKDMTTSCMSSRQVSSDRYAETAGLLSPNGLSPKIVLKSLSPKVQAQCSFYRMLRKLVDAANPEYF